MKALALTAIFFRATVVMAAEAPAPAAAPAELTKEYAAKVIELSIHCAEAESPHYYEGPGGEGKGKARERHPAFFGCFDWHSAVHGHWAMMRVVNKFPELPEAKAALRILNDHLTKEKLDKELAYFKADKGGLFERPYGWAWFLRLAEEASRSKHPDAAKWRLALQPLEDYLVQASIDYMAKLNRPVRYGFHGNTAFALTHLWDYAEAKTKAPLRAAVLERAKLLYGKDRHCPLDYEPSAGDFISPCFTEADLMRRVLGEKEFKRWLNGFLPPLKVAQLAPVIPEDKKDYILGHMIGLMYEKAAAMRGVMESLPAKDQRRGKLEKAVRDQADTAWGLMFDSGYGGTHWIASFALFYYDRVGLATNLK